MKMSESQKHEEEEEENSSKTNSWLGSLGAFFFSFILINQKKKLEHTWAFSISI